MCCTRCVRSAFQSADNGDRRHGIDGTRPLDRWPLRYRWPLRSRRVCGEQTDREKSASGWRSGPLESDVQRRRLDESFNPTSWNLIGSMVCRRGFSSSRIDRRRSSFRGSSSCEWSRAAESAPIRCSASSSGPPPLSETVFSFPPGTPSGRLCRASDPKAPHSTPESQPRCSKFQWIRRSVRHMLATWRLARMVSNF